LIINRYLIREIALPLVTVTTTLMVIFVSYNAAVYTADAAAGLLPASTVAHLTLLRSLIAIEVLLPAALYLAVVMSMGRMYSDNEMVALHATGFSERRVIRSVLWLSLSLAMVVASLSLVVRPWAYQQSYHIKAEAEAEFNLDKLEAGQFYTAEESGTVIFVERINHLQNRLEQVYFYRLNDEGVRVISAQQAWQPVTDPFALPVFKFLDGTAYQIDLSGKRDLTLRFKELTLLLEGDEQKLNRYRSKAASTLQLAGSKKPADLAEFQWRLTTPVTTLLLGILAVPLSRTPPRRGRHAKTVAAVLVFAVFYLLSISARNWVEQGTVGAIPGVWWPHILLGLLILVLLLRPAMWSGSR
jgi:lipopolysaccharide export system permease protein